MSKISDKPLVTDPLTASDVLVAQIGGQTKRVPARKTPRIATSPDVGVLGDCDSWVRLGDGADNDTQVHFTLPANADEPIPVLGQIVVECMSTGGMIIVSADGVTVNPEAANGLAVLYKNGLAVCTKVDTDEWTVAGAQTV